MRRIQAALPAFGQVEVDFHEESEEVLDFLRESGIQRLRRVPQLGIAASVFTGVNHSRWEYVLLQCALLMLVGKLNKNNETFALSSKVQLGCGAKSKVSSGEELLKSWAILSNSGRPQYTYGVEHALMELVKVDKKFAAWLADERDKTPLGRWSAEVVRERRGESLHILLAIRRIRSLPAYDRRKKRLLALLANFVLPLDKLFPEDPVARFKMGRLRNLFKRIRLLSIVTLDAYYSAYPIRVQLNAALSNLATLCEGQGTSGLEKLLSMTAGALADEIYLHPSSIAALREYEIHALTVFQKRFLAAEADQGKLEHFYQTVMSVGAGRPRSTRLKHLARFTFGRAHAILSGDNLLDAQHSVQSAIATPPATYVAVNQNSFTGKVHVDLLQDRHISDHEDICAMFLNSTAWLIKQLDAEALRGIRDTLPQRIRDNAEKLEAIRAKAFARALKRGRLILVEVFEAIMRYVLPEGRRIAIAEVPEEEQDDQILVRITDGKNVMHDLVTPILERHLNTNPRGYSRDRLHEIRAVDHLFKATDAPIVFVCLEDFTIRDELGKSLDEWDGVVVALSASEITISVVEAKYVSSPHQTCETAFKQLKASRPFLCSRHKLKAQRIRLPGLGAALTCRVT